MSEQSGGRKSAKGWCESGEQLWGRFLQFEPGDGERLWRGGLSAHHMLSPWTFEEIQTYLKAALEAVGINRSKVFEPAAVDLLVRATAGVPRSVCLLARAAWLEAARADAREISAQTMQQALEQVPGLTGLTRHSS